jgi:hypothetical protein
VEIRKWLSLTLHHHARLRHATWSARSRTSSKIADFVEDFATEYFGGKANVIDLCGAGAAHAESQINHLLFGLRKISAMAGALQDALAD